MMKILEYLTKVTAWLLIAAAPTLVGIIIGAFTCQLALRNTMGIVIGVIIAFTGFIVGAIWATRICFRNNWKAFERHHSSPELDRLER